MCLIRLAYPYTNGLVQDCSNSRALAMELLQSCTKPSIQSGAIITRSNIVCIQHNDESTIWGWNKMAAIFHTTFSNGFSLMKMHESLLRFHWSLFLRFQLTIIQHWFREWLGTDQATIHYLNQWWLDYWYIYASLGLNELSRTYTRVNIHKIHITSRPDRWAMGWFFWRFGRKLTAL